MIGEDELAECYCRAVLMREQSRNMNGEPDSLALFCCILPVVIPSPRFCQAGNLGPSLDAAMLFMPVSNILARACLGQSADADVCC